MSKKTFISVLFIIILPSLLTSNVKTAIDWCGIGIPYKAADGLTVILHEFYVIEKAGSYQYIIKYTLRNDNTDKKILEGTFKLYYKDKPGGLPQYGFFNYLYPGDSITRVYVFEELKSVQFDVLAYHQADEIFFSDEPPEGSLKWKVVYPDNTPPTIHTPLCIIEKVSEQSYKVRVLANVTDSLSGVKNVTLSYNLTNNNVWRKMPMVFNTSKGLYETVIPEQPIGTIIKFEIIAYDIAGNFKVEDNNGQYYTIAIKYIPFEASNLKISPTQTEINKEVTISLNVKNLEEVGGICSVILKINGKVEAVKNVTLLPGETTSVSFGIVKDTPGTYSVEVEGLEGIFVITLPDTTPPITVNDYDNLWHTWYFYINLTATDDLSGVAETYYRINGGYIHNVTFHGQPFISDESANNTLEYWSVDNAGNEEEHHFLKGIKLDMSPPTGSIAINEGSKYTNNTLVNLILLAYDKVSGVAEVHLSNDGSIWSSWEPYSSSKSWILDGGDGLKTVYVQFRDNAGLVSKIYEASIILDMTKPLADAGPSQTVKVGEPIVLDAIASDNTAVVGYEWNLGDGTIVFDKTVSYVYKNPGTYQVTLKVRDAAGNIGLSKKIITVQDTTPSTTFTTSKPTSTASFTSPTTLTPATTSTPLARGIDNTTIIISIVSVIAVAVLAFTAYKIKRL